jgi:broad specificity phosphatase PhoE
MEFLNKNEFSETAPKLLFKVTLIRHEKPFYEDKGHDLTPEGVEGAQATGKKLKDGGIVSDDEEIFLVHSPKARAKGTLDFITENAGIEGKSKRTIDQLRSSDYANHEAFLEHLEKIGGTMEALAEEHYKNSEIFEKRPDIVEPQSHKKERLYRTLEYLIRWFNKHPVESKTPHVIAVSHFEIITHLIDDVFDIESFGKYNIPDYGEAVYIEAYNTGDKNKILLKVTYNKKTKTVYFNRKNRSVEVV